MRGRGSIAWVGAFCLVMAASAQSGVADEDDPCSKAADAGKVLLRVTSDANCKLTVNKEPHGALTANQERSITVAGGRLVTRCASTELAGAVADDEQEILAGCGTVTFEVAGAWRRFSAKKGVVADAETGLSWIPSDNGGDVNWQGAKKYCADKGGRLPTKEELRQLYLGSAASTPCGEFPCRMSHLFRLSGRFFWSDSVFAPGQPIAVGFSGSAPGLQSVSETMTKDVRALCVAAAK